MTEHGYRQAQHLANGSDPIEAGVVANLADNECVHERLPHDNTKRCGCWREEGAVLKVIEEPRKPRQPRKRPERMSYETAQLIVDLRLKGMMMPDIVIALDHFLDIQVNYNQVRHLTYNKMTVKRGERPSRTRDRDTRRTA